MAVKFPSFKLTGLWRQRDFMLLWSGQTISVFGSLIGGSAMSFVAVTTLSATPFQMGLLQWMQLLPAFLIGLFAGVWVDRLRRRPLLIAADIGRALVLCLIPLAAVFGFLRIELVFGVALVVSILTIFFDVSYQSYLPGLISKDQLVEGNSKMAASASVAEVSGFGLAGVLVQLLSAPLAVLIDAASFVVSVISVALIRTPEVKAEAQAQPDMRREIIAGLRVVLHQPLLRASAICIFILGLANGIYGSQVVLYMIRGVGLAPALLTLTWAVGGVSSLVGAVLVPHANRLLGAGKAMVLGLFASGLSSLLVIIASGPTLLSFFLLAGAQLGDGFHLIYDINQISLRQSLAPAEALGRVNATMSFLTMGGSLLGALLGGLLGEGIGSRWALVVGMGLTLATALYLAQSPLSRFTSAPAPETGPA